MATGQSEITLRFLAAPTDVATLGGSIHGGRVLEWIDKSAYALAVGWSGGYCVTAYVGNVTTPTMVMTGEIDLRTPIGQSEEFYKALKMQKKEAVLVRMPDEFHVWRRPSHRLMQQLYLLAWFDKHKKAGTTTTE